MEECHNLVLLRQSAIQLPAMGSLKSILEQSLNMAEVVFFGVLNHPQFNHCELGSHNQD